MENKNEEKGKGDRTYQTSTSEVVMKERVFEVVWPCGEKVGKITPLSKRVDTLKDKTICELWDSLFRGDKIFQILEEELSRRYPGVKFVNYQVFGSTHGGEERKVIAALPSMLKEKGCDAVISSMGC